MLNTVPAVLPTDLPIRLRLEALGPRLRAWILSPGPETAPSIDVTDADPVLGAGLAGVKTRGAAIGVDDLRVETGGRTVALLEGASLTTPRERALAAFCLLLLNLNEVVYVE